MEEGHYGVPGEEDNLMLSLLNSKLKKNTDMARNNVSYVIIISRAKAECVINIKNNVLPITLNKLVLLRKTPGDD